MARLSTHDLTKTYSGNPVVNRVNLQFESGLIHALLGRNGAGKTTTFLMLVGIIKPDGGTVVLDDSDLAGVSSDKRARMGLIYLPQQHSVFFKATTYNNLHMILEMRFPEPDADRQTRALIDEFGLGEVADSYGYQLSGGEKRRLEIARALIMNPKFLFLDEPFTGIDPITILGIQKLIQKLKEKGIGMIITDHNVKDTFFITDRAYIIHQGSILSSGAPVEIVREERTRQLFLGTDFDWHA